MIFEGDPSGTQNKKGMAMISDRNYNIRARDPLGILQFFSVNTATILGRTHDDAHWCAQKSRGITNDFVPPLLGIALVHACRLCALESSS